MYTLTIELRKEMENTINTTLAEATSSDYSMSILNSEIKTHQNKVCKMMDMIGTKDITAYLMYDSQLDGV